MRTVTFKRGGVHPSDKKELSSHQMIKDLQLPDTVYVSLAQHLGKPAKAIVKVKQELSAGDIIGEPDGFISAYVHSPVSGIVKKVEKMASVNGTYESTVIIDVDKDKTEDDLKKFTVKTTENILELENSILVERIQKSGIVGQGGATFPTNVKLMPPKEKTIDTLLLNGAECEPYLTADHQLMLENPEEILTGAVVLKKILGAKQCLVGIEANKEDAIELISLTIKKMNLDSFEVVKLKTRYPQGGEKQLIQAATGREVPSGKLPMDVGTVVQNIGTVFAVYEALYFNKPFIDRITTITGYVNQPGNYRLILGVPFDYAISEGAGGYIDGENVYAVINGGPMMGKAIRQSDVPVLKGTSGILVMSDEDASYREEGPCIRCGRCINVCPMGLMPTEMAVFAKAKESELLNDAMDCIECGSCSYICPTDRQLVHWIRIGKALYRNKNRR